MMRIGELAERLAVNPKTIRYYESISVLPEPERTPSGYRTYTETDVDRVAFIKTAQRLGITLDEIREILALRERGERPCAYVRDVVRRELAAIDERLAELRQLRRDLTELDKLADALPEAENGFTCRLIDHVRARAEAAASSGTSS
jgi:DNA-binding transcriptional MerR regulator